MDAKATTNGGRIIMAKEAYYFSHDSNARQDPKVSEMISVYGAEGYGRYWMIVEMLREEGNHRLNISGKYSFNAFALQLHCKSEEAKEFIMDCINEFRLFESDGESFWSNSLMRRMAMREEVSQKRKKAAEKRWGKKPDAEPSAENEDANPMQMHSKPDANAMQGKERKGKESKLKEIKDKDIKTSSSPKQVYDEESDEMILVRYFIKKIRVNSPDFREPNLQTWADDFRKLMTINKKDKKEIAEVIHFVQTDSFEIPNVMSPAKLRKRYESLFLKMRQPKGAKNNGSIQQRSEQPSGTKYDGLSL